MNLPHEGSGWHTPVPDGHPAAALLRAEAVRERCAAVMARVQAGDSPLFEWHGAQLAPCAAYVADTVRRAYPDLAVPYHSRWRHFEAGGRDRWAGLQAAAGLAGDARECARVAVDLVIPSVLLDAGAGPDWRFHEADDQPPLTRSEGLAVASLALFAAGTLSDDPARPLRSDAAALRRIDAAMLGALFQVSSGNPLLGLEGRATLLNRLGEVVEATPAVFGRPARLGNLVDHLFALATDGRLPADELLPFHKLTQWLAYSLLEPLQAAGLEITGLDALTGLPEYRNGGLLLDFGVIAPRHPAFYTTRWTVDALPIVEWRALTVAGLDRLAEAVRAELDVSTAAFPLARVLQGGSWSAGRRIAAERRPGGAPPLQLESDGTVF